MELQEAHISVHMYVARSETEPRPRLDSRPWVYYLYPVVVGNRLLLLFR